MNLHGRKSVDPRWTRHADPVLDLFLSCEIELYDKAQINDGQSYNWKTNTGSGGARTLLWSGPAQLQVYRFTLTMDAPVGSVDQIRSARFTVEHAGVEDLDIRRGMQIKVVDCPNDTTLERYQYIVNSALNSGASFRRTIETEVDMTRVVN